MYRHSAAQFESAYSIACRIGSFGKSLPASVVNQAGRSRARARRGIAARQRSWQAFLRQQILPFGLAPVAQFALDCVQLADPHEGDLSPRDVGVLSVLKFSSGVGPAGDLVDLSPGLDEDPVVAAEGVGLKIALEILQDAGGAIAFPIGRVIEPHEPMRVVPE